MYPVECVARGYLTGSGLLDYRATGEVCGIPLPDGLEDGSRLPEPIFTPATKADLGEHDENVSYDAVVETVGAERADELRQLTLDVYARAEGIARERGIILADTKLEFGARGDGTIGARRRGAHPGLVAVLAGRRVAAGPRRSRRTTSRSCATGLLSPESGWDRASGEPPPPLPAEVVERTRARYVEAYELLTGPPSDAPSSAVACEFAVRPRDGVRLPRRPAPSTGVAVLAQARLGGRRRAAGRPDLGRRDEGRDQAADADHRARPAGALERVRHLALRPRRPDPRPRPRPGGCACATGSASTRSARSARGGRGAVPASAPTSAAAGLLAAQG